MSSTIILHENCTTFISFKQMTKPYCSKRHGMPNGAASPKPLNCKYCGAANTNFDWYCNKCYRCLDCQRIIKRKIDDPNVVNIKGLPKFEHTRNLVRTYCLKEGSEYIKDGEFNTIIEGKDLVGRVLGGELDLLKKDT